MSSSDGPLLFRFYLGIVSVVTFFILVFSATNLLTLGLKTYVFPAADVPFDFGCPMVEVAGDEGETTRMDCEKQKIIRQDSYRAEKARELAKETATIVVAGSVFFLHFWIFWREKNKV